MLTWPPLLTRLAVARLAMVAAARWLAALVRPPLVTRLAAARPAAVVAVARWRDPRSRSRLRRAG